MKTATINSMLCSLMLWMCASGFAPAAEITPPRALVEGVRVELIASEPEIVTPVGMAFDKSGRLLVVESHTHKRQEGYDGPRGDRIRTLSDTNGDGRLDGKTDKWGTFAEGYTHAMNLAVRANGDVYLVCRNSVHRLRDTNDDGVADEDEVIVRLETKETYPHNGLGGIAFTRVGLALGLGENFGADYKLVGSDGSEIKGRGGVGIVFYCDWNGAGLQQHAKGFWNPFGLAMMRHNDHDYLFTVDNDPDASPPCRLIHVLSDGDYGHRWEYGRAGLHPLQAWDGELPGTLGMLAGTGEAPCAIVPHRGYLWVTSWGEHRIERYELSKAEEWKLGAKRKIAVQGNADFRPTGMAIAPDGSLYFGDWVSRSYPVHGAGRIWRVTLSPEVKAPEVTLPRLFFASEQLNKVALFGTPPVIPLGLLDFDALGNPLPKSGESAIIHQTIAADYDQWKQEVSKNSMSVTGLIGPREQYPSHTSELVSMGLASENPDVRLYAVRWIADEHLTEFKSDVVKLLDGEISSERYYLAVLAAVDWLSGDRQPRSGGIADELLIAELENANRLAATKALALRLLSPDHKFLSMEKLREYLQSEATTLRTEAVRTLVVQTNAARFALLAEIAMDETKTDALRADATGGLAGDVNAQQPVLEKLARTAPQQTQAAAQQALRLAKLAHQVTETKPAATETDTWLKLIDQSPGDADSGRRLFYSAVGARCGICHQHSGRGGNIGPELTHTAAKLSRTRLVESILQPSLEVSPRYEPWLLETDEGKVLTGLRLPQGGDNGIEPYADSQGKRFTLRSDLIESRTPSPTSIMPSGLEQTISVQDLRDLLAFLAGEKK